MELTCSYVLVSLEVDYYYGNNDIKDLVVAFSVSSVSVEKAKKAMLACATFVPLQKKNSKLDMPKSASSQFGHFALLSMR